MESLPEEQYDFVIRGIVDEGWTPRDAEREFAIRFPGEKLPKSNVDRWWKAVGKELAERYRLRRYQIRVVKEQLEADGIDIKAGAYKAIINNVEDHLLTSERDLISSDPIKLLGLRQEDERLKIKREQIALNQSKLDFEKQKHEAEVNSRKDVLAIGAKTWQFILLFMNENEPHVVDALTRRANDILIGLEGHLLDETS